MGQASAKSKMEKRMAAATASASYRLLNQKNHTSKRFLDHRRLVTNSSEVHRSSSSSRGKVSLYSYTYSYAPLFSTSYAYSYPNSLRNPHEIMFYNLFLGHTSQLLFIVCNIS